MIGNFKDKATSGNKNGNKEKTRKKRVVRRTGANKRDKPDVKSAKSRTNKK
jgi:hypothetical protein